jgi:hypothetical protein
MVLTGDKGPNLKGYQVTTREQTSTMLTHLYTTSSNPGFEEDMSVRFLEALTQTSDPAFEGDINMQLLESLDNLCHEVPACNV